MQYLKTANADYPLCATCIAYTAQKTKFFIKDYFSNVTRSAETCGFGHIYWRNP